MNATRFSTGENGMTTAGRRLLFAALAAGAVAAGCGPTFDAASLVETTRVLGARVTAGTDAPARATPSPGEAAAVTWLGTGPTAPAAQGWVFALCQPALSGELTCGSAPYAVYQGNEVQPAVAMTMPDAGTLGAATSGLLYGRICDGAAPTFDPQSGLAGCAAAAAGTTAAVTIEVGGADTVNHNPTAERGLTFDGQPWPAPDDATDPCGAGPFVAAGTKDHVVTLLTAATN